MLKIKGERIIMCYQENTKYEETYSKLSEKIMRRK